MHKVVVVTGGSRGIGKVIAKRFLKQGDFVLIAARNKKELTKTCQELDPKGNNLTSFVADVSKRVDCKKMIQFAFKKFGRIDVLINNAGIFGPMGLFEKNDLSEWTDTLSINLLGTIHCCHEIIPYFKKQKQGKIINMTGAGIGGKRPLAHFSSYYTSKGAIACFTEVLAAELSQANIQVNCISPGAVYTHLTDLVLKNGKEKAGDFMYNQAREQKNTGGDSPELTADLILFLASKDAKHITGKILSAVWDKKMLQKQEKPISTNIYTLRRIDDVLFFEKKR